MEEVAAAQNASAVGNFICVFGALFFFFFFIVESEVKWLADRCDVELRRKKKKKW